jgi:hypothetical protein
MIDPAQALAAAARPPLPMPLPSTARRVLVVGGAGPLGSALVESLLGAHRFERVAVAVLRRVSPALRGLVIVDDSDTAWQAFAPESALIVFDRERKANGRDDAFVRPQPEQLLGLATRLRAAGARQLIVALPHAPAMLPQALKAGLASLDEGAVADLGFDHVVFMRLAQTGLPAGADEASRPQRLADWMLRQLHWMVPSSEQPVRRETVARVVARLLIELPATPAGTRVLPPELLWHAAQATDLEPLVQRWLAGEALPPQWATRQRW